MDKKWVACMVMLVSFCTGLTTMALLLCFGLAPLPSELIPERLFAVLILIQIPFLASLLYIMKHKTNLTERSTFQIKTP
jgi:hypothetical protein